MSEVKPKLLYIYDYEMPPHQVRIPRSSPYQLEQALKEFFDVYRDKEINVDQVDLVFNTLPITTGGGTGYDMFTKGPMTAFWTTSPLEGIGQKYFDDCDIIFNSIPSWANKMPPDKTVTLLDAADPEYKEYPSEKIYDVGFLGSVVEGTRVDLLNKIDSEFKLLKGSKGLGEESARALSQCQLVLSIQDWNWHNAGIERRLFTFGNIRPILVRDNEDYRIIGQSGVDYIPYVNDDDCLKQLHKYLDPNVDIEIIGNNLKEILKHHTFRDRAKTVYEAYLAKKI
jgi:hypothetical protein